MQHIIEEIKENFQSFLSDEEKTVLLVQAAAEESLLILKTLDMLEEDETSPDIYAALTDGFTDARSYVDALYELQSIQLEAVNNQLAENGEPILEEFPPELSNRRIINHDRLIGIAAHVRKIVPPERKVILIFFPLEEAAAEDAYANLMRYLAFEICDGKIENTKIIIRDTPTLAVSARMLEKETQTAHYQPKLDTDSIFEKIEAQAKNPDAPPDERAQNMMLMAGVDIAEKRFDRALQRNETVLTYFEQSGQKQKQSVVHNNIGDIHYLQGDFPQAQKRYEKAVEISIDEESQPMMIYQSINVGNALFMQGKYGEALIYYDSAAKLAKINKALQQEIQALERVGDTQKAQGEIEKAVETWENAAEICREAEYKLGLIGILEKLDAAYEETHENDKRRAIEPELAEAKDEIGEIAPALLEK